MLNSTFADYGDCEDVAANLEEIKMKKNSILKLVLYSVKSG